jgi:hypothetical protein
LVKDAFTHPSETGLKLEFALLSALLGLMVLKIFFGFYHFDLQDIQNKTIEYRAYLSAWVLFPFGGAALAFLTDLLYRSRFIAIPYRRILIFLNFVLVLAAYWDVQNPHPWPGIAWLALFAAAQTAAYGISLGLIRFGPQDPGNASVLIYLPMIVLLGLWLTLMIPDWRNLIRPWHSYNYFFAATVGFAFVFGLDFERPIRGLIPVTKVQNFIVYLIVGLMAAFLFIDPFCNYDSRNLTFYMGPVADFVNGKSLLVDINAQYGVFVFYFLKFVFSNLLPMGLTSFYFLDAILRLSQYLLFFYIARQLFRSASYAFMSMFVLILLNCILIPGPCPLFYPSQGALRFGFIYILVVLVILRNRFPQKKNMFFWAEALTAATAFFWSFEVCFYTVPAYGLLMAYESLFDGGPLHFNFPLFFKRLKMVAVGILLIGGYITLDILNRSGQFPHWDHYFNYIFMYRNGYGMIATPLFGTWWIIVGIIYFSFFLIFAARTSPDEKIRAHMNVLVLAAFYGIFQLFYYLGRSAPTNVIPLVMPATLLGLFWLYILRVAPAQGTVKVVKVSLLVSLVALLIFCVQPIVSVAQVHLDWECQQLSFPQMAWDFLMASRDEPRKDAFAKNAEQLMEKYSENHKYPVYLFGGKGVDVAMFNGRSKAYPYDDIDQAVFSTPVVYRTLATQPVLKPGDCVYTSPDMADGDPILGGGLHLEETLFNQLNARYFLRPVETSGTITVYKVMGEKNLPAANPKKIHLEKAFKF